MTNLIRSTRIVLLLLLLPNLIGGAGASAQERSRWGFALDTLEIATADGMRHRLKVELALEPEEKAQGLMFRRELNADSGMLFVYREERPVHMWMKNTLIPLDMLFISKRGEVVEIVARTTPLSEMIIASNNPVLAVLELNGGAAERLGIKAGDQVLGRYFESP